MSIVKKIVLDLQSRLYAKAIRRLLVQELDNYQVVISKSPSETAKQCNLLHPYALLMEVTGYTPWRLEERLSIRDMVKKDSDDCKVILIVDDVSEPELAENLKNAKQSGLIDAFLFTSTTENYLDAEMDSL